MVVKMGVAASRFWTRLTEFPIKNKPISFHLQKNITSTGEEKSNEVHQKTDAYDDLQNAFVKKLMEVGEHKDRWLSEKFPHWNQMTIEDLNDTYTLLASEENGMMDLKRFCWFLDSIEDATSAQVRQEKFNSVDNDNDGFINVDEFLLIVYNYSSLDEEGGLKGVAKVCLETADMIRNASLLSIGQQLQQGLF